jgi:hypothetical protein
MAADLNASSKLNFLSSVPPPAQIVRALALMHHDDRRRFCRLWMSEGIPSAFLSTPMLYENIREWMGEKLHIQPKFITLIGSGRFGYSMAPRSFGTPFGRHSDLDLSIISNELFASIAEEFQSWSRDYLSGLISPLNPRDGRFWPQNSRLVPRNIAKGFIDPFKVPSMRRYPESKRMKRTEEQLEKLLVSTPGAPIVKRVSVRVYRDWDAFVGQTSFNLARTAAEVAIGPAVDAARSAR